MDQTSKLMSAEWLKLSTVSTKKNRPMKLVIYSYPIIWKMYQAVQRSNRPYLTKLQENLTAPDAFKLMVQVGSCITYQHFMTALLLWDKLKTALVITAASDSPLPHWLLNWFSNCMTRNKNGAQVGKGSKIVEVAAIWSTKMVLWLIKLQCSCCDWFTLHPKRVPLP